LDLATQKRIIQPLLLLNHCEMLAFKGHSF